MKMTLHFFIAFLIVITLSNTSCQPTDYSADINALKASRDSLAAALKITNANLQTTNSNLAALSTSVTTIQAQLTVISGQISTLNTQLTATNTTVAGHTTTIATIQSQIKTIQDQIAVINTKQDATATVVNSTALTVASIQAQLNSVLTQIATLNSQNTTINKTLGDLSNALTLSTSQLGNLLTQLNALLAKVPTLADVDGNVYKTVIIGTQVWMAENLRTKKYRDGTPIPYVTNSPTWINLSTGAYCYYAFNSSFGTEYGPLYNWYAVADSRNLCPTGWHIPSDNEWSVLINYLGGADAAGGKMKEVGTTHWNTPNTGADNSSGFTALGGGWIADSGGGYYWYWMGNWWSSTLFDSNSPWLININSDMSRCLRTHGAYYEKKAGLSVRCIKD